MLLRTYHRRRRLTTCAARPRSARTSPGACRPIPPHPHRPDLPTMSQRSLQPIFARAPEGALRPSLSPSSGVRAAQRARAVAGSEAGMSGGQGKVQGLALSPASATWASREQAREMGPTFPTQCGERHNRRALCARVSPTASIQLDQSFSHPQQSLASVRVPATVALRSTRLVHPSPASPAGWPTSRAGQSPACLEKVRGVLHWAAGRRVTSRTMAGGTGLMGNARGCEHLMQSTLEGDAVRANLAAPRALLLRSALRSFLQDHSQVVLLARRTSSHPRAQVRASIFRSRAPGRASIFRSRASGRASTPRHEPRS
jgi:hypothetical protein